MSRKPFMRVRSEGDGRPVKDAELVFFREKGITSDVRRLFSGIEDIIGAVSVKADREGSVLLPENWKDYAWVRGRAPGFLAVLFPIEVVHPSRDILLPPSGKVKVVLKGYDEVGRKEDLFLSIWPWDQESGKYRRFVLSPRGDGSLALDRARYVLLRSRISEIDGFIPGGKYKFMAFSKGVGAVQSGWKEAVCPNIVYLDLEVSPVLGLRLVPPPSSPGACVVWALGYPAAEEYVVEKGQEFLRIPVDCKEPGRWMVGGLGEDWVGFPVGFSIPQQGTEARSFRKDLFLEEEKHAVIRIVQGIESGFPGDLSERLHVSWVEKNGSIEEFYDRLSLEEYLSSGSHDYTQVCVTKDALIFRNLPFYPCPIIIFDEWYGKAYLVVVKDRNFRGRIRLSVPPLSLFLEGRRLVQEVFSKPGTDVVTVLIDQGIQVGKGRLAWVPVRSFYVKRKERAKWTRPSFWSSRFVRGRKYRVRLVAKADDSIRTILTREIRRGEKLRGLGK